MKHYLLNIPYFVIFFACILCGCSSEEGSDVLKTKELSVECFVDGESLETRAIKTTSYFTAGDDIGVWAFKDNGSAYSSNQNVWVRYNGAVWRFHNSIPLSNEDATVYACYPWSGESTNNAETYIYPGTVDYLYGSCSTKNNADNPRAILRFNHAMARLTFRFKLTSDSDPDNLLAPHLVYLWLTDTQNILINKARLNVKTGSITAIERGKAVEYSTVQKLSRTSYATVDMLVIPCNLGSGKVTLHFSINGEHYQEDLKGDNWQAGQQYTYDVPIHLTHWNQDKPVTPTTGTDNGHEWVDLGLSVKWATCNIGAKSPEEYGKFYAWGETQAKTYFNWSNYKLSDNKVDRIYYTNKNDTILKEEDDAASSNWHGKWRMPLNSEFLELIEKCSFQWVENYNGSNNHGYIIKSKVAGYENEYIFLPAAGLYFGYDHRSTNDQGTYWAKNRSLTPQFKYWDIYNLWFHKSKQDVTLEHGYTGLPIRPVLPK